MNAYNKLMHTLIGATITAALVAIPATASATQFQVQITGTGAFSGISYDSGIVNSNLINAGVSFSGADFTYDISVNNASGGAPSFLDSTFGAYNNSGTGGTVTILASATDYTSLTAGAGAYLVGNIGGTINGTATVSAQSWINSSNALNAMTGSTIAQGPFSSAAFSDSSATTFIASNPFSLTHQIILNVAAQSSTTGDFNTNIPEPGTLALLGLGLLGAGVLRRRQTKA